MGVEPDFSGHLQGVAPRLEQGESAVGAADVGGQDCCHSELLA